MRTFAAVFVGGALGLLLLKVVLGLIGPLLALFFGFVALALKVALFAALAYFVYMLLKGRRREREDLA